MATTTAKFWIFTMLAITGGLVFWGSAEAHCAGDIKFGRFVLQAIPSFGLMVVSGCKINSNGRL